MMRHEDLKDFLEEKAEEYNNINFIENDPILIPHQFSQKADIEIIGFLIASIAWGNRKSIIKNGNRLIDIMGNQPYQFILNASKNELNELNFVHRTFNVEDLKFFIRFLQSVYRNGENIELLFSNGNNIKDRIINFRQSFLTIPHEKRSEKHISNPDKGSASKRINMYLRWMVRKDKKGVDFGIWNSIKMSELMIPLDVHTGNVARKLEILKRKSNDWKALEELMNTLKKMDPVDPCKYDFALFGIGVNKVI